MFVATPTHRNLKNQSTGIDITVPCVVEVEAPLGGTTTEYEISVVTNLPNYKSKLHKEEDVVHFTVQKAYREVEDFYDKVSKKFIDSSLPSIPRGRATLLSTSEEKKNSLDKFMKHISQTKEICHSSLFQQFIGIGKLKKQSLENVQPKECDFKPDLVSTAAASDDLEGCKNAVLDDVQNAPLNSENDISELFPKMKVRKSSQTNSLKEEDYLTTNTDMIKHEKITSVEELDLVEEAKQIKEVKNKETQLFSSDVKSHHGLFDSSEDDMNLFRVNSPTPVKNIKNTVSNKAKPVLKDIKAVQNEKSVISNMPASEKIFSLSKDEEIRKDPDSLFKEEISSPDQKNSGNIFLFEEQDFGTGITKDDEELFYIPKSESKKFNANPFLSPSSDSTEENDVEESIEELTSLVETSVSMTPKWEETSKVPKTESRASEAVNVSLEPSKKSSVIPRKDSIPKPPLPPKPTIPPKPKAAGKPPVPAKKPSVKQPTESCKDALQKPSSEVQNISSIDIMQYIEQEQKLANAKTSLFD